MMNPVFRIFPACQNCNVPIILDCLAIIGLILRILNAMYRMWCPSQEFN